MEKTLQLLELVKEAAEPPYMPWQPTIQREPEFNPFHNIVAELNAIEAPTIH